jgi:hypothetical protein
VYTGQCPVLQRRRGSGTRQSREFAKAAPLKFTGQSGVHRTVRCTPDCPVQQRGNGYFRRQRLPAAHLLCARSAQSSGTREQAHRTLYSTCLVRHRTSRRAQKTELQRSTQRLFGDVAVAPDMSGVHRTVRCAIEQTTSPNG